MLDQAAASRTKTRKINAAMADLQGERASLKFAASDDDLDLSDWERHRAFVADGARPDRPEMVMTLCGATYWAYEGIYPMDEWEDCEHCDAVYNDDRALAEAYLKWCDKLADRDRLEAADHLSRWMRKERDRLVAESRGRFRLARGPMGILHFARRDSSQRGMLCGDPPVSDLGRYHNPFMCRACEKAAAAEAESVDQSQYVSPSWYCDRSIG